MNERERGDAGNLIDRALAAMSCLGNPLKGSVGRTVPT